MPATASAMAGIRSKVRSGGRLTREEGLELLQRAGLLELGALAQEVRFRHNPERAVTFVIDTNFNYSNVCDAYCTFCAFFRPLGHTEAYAFTPEEMVEKIGRAAAEGVTTVLLQGGLHPELPLEYYEELVRLTCQRYPQVLPHFFSAPEILKMSEVSGLSVRDVLARLQAAGQRTLPGGGAEILSDRVKRKISRLYPKNRVADWVAVHREAQRLGYRTTATMMYGHLEEDEDVIEHLEVVRALQDETGGFTAFVPWSYKRENTALGKKVKEEAGPNRYLRIIALSRLYLDNVPHVQASWFSEGKKTGQVALNFGADDFGGTLFEESVMLAAGFYNRTTVEEVMALIREAGFQPVQRTTLYEITQRF
jgi:cyclic dehypoxanthinyl futalosine synthase